MHYEEKSGKVSIKGKPWYILTKVSWSNTGKFYLHWMVASKVSFEDYVSFKKNSI